MSLQPSGQGVSLEEEKVMRDDKPFFFTAMDPMDESQEDEPCDVTEPREVLVVFIIIAIYRMAGECIFDFAKTFRLQAISIPM